MASALYGSSSYGSNAVFPKILSEGELTRKEHEVLREKAQALPRRLPVVIALQDEEEAIDELFGMIEQLSEAASPLLSPSYSEKAVNETVDHEPHSSAVGISEHNARRIRRAADMIEDLKQRLGV